MDDESLNKRLCDVSIAMMIAWYVLLAIAMVAVPGGYDFFASPVSALGYTVMNGQPNTVSTIFYTLAFCCLIPGSALLMIIIPRTLSGNPVGRRLAIIGDIPGVVGLVFIVVSLNAPGDTAAGMHIFAASMGFLCIDILAAFFSAATWKAKEYPRLVPALWLLLVALTFVYGMFIFTTDYSILFFKVIMDTMQKFVEYILVTSLLYMACIAKKQFSLDASKARKM